MRKQFDCDNGIEEYNVDYMVLFGAYDNERPLDHYNNRKSCGKVYETVEKAKEIATGYQNARIWEVAHEIDCGDISFVTEIR